MKSCHSSCVFPAYCVPLQPQFQSSCSDLDTYLPLQLLLLEQSGYLRLPLLVYLHVIRHKNKCQSPTKLKMIMIWVLGRRRRNKNGKKTPMLHTHLTAHADNVSNTTQISHNTATRVYRDKSCADDIPLCEGSGALN